MTERQKATRHLKKLHRRLAEVSDTEDVKSVEAQIHNAEVDLNYTIYCPLHEKYTGLYPRKEDGEDEEVVIARHMGEKPWLPLWKVVEKCMEEGTLAELRNGSGPFEARARDDNESDVLGDAKAKSHTGLPVRLKKSQHNGHVKSKPPKDVDEESDGGFFEE